MAHQLDPLTLAHHKFMVALHDHRPRPFVVDASPAALRQRACDIDALTLAFTDYISFLVEDSAANMWLRKDLATSVRNLMEDAASEIRGEMSIGIEDRVAS
jgi:hypothetical protein